MHSDVNTRADKRRHRSWLSPRRVPFWLFMLLGVYVVVGFIVLPRVLEHYLVKTAQEAYGRELIMGSVWTNPFMLSLRVNELEFHDTDGFPLVTVERVATRFTWSGLFSGDWTIRSIHFDQPVVREERVASGNTRFTELIDDISQEEEVEEEDAPELISLYVNNVTIVDGVFRFTDHFNTDLATTPDTDAPDYVAIAVHDISLEVDDFVLNDDSESSVHLTAAFAGGGVLKFDGSLHIRPEVNLNGHITLDAISMTQASAYLQHYLDVRLESGAFAFTGELSIGSSQPFTYTGTAAINDLSISQAAEDETLLAWQSIRTEHFHIDVNARTIETDFIFIDGLAGQLTINEDMTTNFGQLGSPPAEDEETRDTEAVANTIDADTDAGEQRAADAERAAGAYVSDEAADAADDAESDSSIQTDDTADAEAYSIYVEAIEISDSGLRFSDNSLPLPFSVNIHSLAGNISTISTTSTQSARLEIQGQVEDYGLARGEGDLYAFQPTRETNITVIFRNIETPDLSPYAAAFAGRTIAKGIMDVDLEYSIEDEQLDGSNNFVIRQIRLGEKLDEEAMDLRLRIAIALLEDYEGEIDLNLHVRGDTNDPEFDIGAIIRDAIFRAITNLIETPFLALADLLDPEESLGQIEFAAGSSELGPPQQQRISEIRETLNEFPNATLDLVGPYNREFDGPVIKRNKVITALRERYEDAGYATRNLRLTSETSLEFIEPMYREFFPESDLDAVRERFSQAPYSTGEVFDALAYRNYLADLVVAAQAVTGHELAALGTARAKTVRDALSDTNGSAKTPAINTDRIRIVESEAIDDVEKEMIIMEMSARPE